jgi:CubicO group peptidase (beta-lactamase class C family)
LDQIEGLMSRTIIPKADWDRPPHNRWAFQHIREILPTAEVWRGDGPVRGFDRAEVDLDQLPVKSLSGIDVSLSAFLDETYTDGVVVLRNGAIVYERYLNGMTPRTLHLSQSVAKSTIGMLYGIFAGRGQIDLSAPLSNYLPELENTGYRGASVQQVLNMTSGIKFDETYTDPYSDIGQSDVASGWKPVPEGSDPAFKWPTDIWSQILGLKEVTRAHGAAFEYRSIETDVLAFCLERVSGKRLPQILSEEIWQKLSMEESANFTVDPAGYALASGGLNATLRDYARFGQMVLENGAGIVPTAYVADTRKGNPKIFQAPYNIALPEGAYKNQFWIEDHSEQAVMCRGVFGQLIYISWKYNMVVVKLSSWPDFLNVKYTVATLAAVHRIGAAV